MTDKLRKYVLPNIPYVFIGWVFLKLGTAYRLAAGGDFAHKFIGLGQTVGAAFANFAPGLAPFDWLVGIVGAAAFRLLIYFKSKNAKKFRRDDGLSQEDFQERMMSYYTALSELNADAHNLEKSITQNIQELFEKK